MKIAALVLASFLVGMTKAGFGSGAGIIAVPIVLLAFGPNAMQGILLPILIAADLMAFYHYRGKWDRRNISMLIPGFTVGVVASSPLLMWFNESVYGPRVLMGFVGILCIMFISMNIYLQYRNAHQTDEDKIKPPYRPKFWHGLLVGFTAGFSSTLAHAAGPIVGVFLISQQLEKRTLVGTGVFYFVYGNLIKLIPHYYYGILTNVRHDHLYYILPVILIGSFVGSKLNSKLSAKWFNIAVYSLVLASGIHMTVKSIIS